MIDQSDRNSGDQAPAKFGLVEAVLIGAVFYFIMTYVDPALRLGFGLLGLTAIGAYFALAFGLERLHHRLPDGNSPDAVAIKFSTVAAVLLGAACLCIVIQGELADRQRMKVLLLAIAGSDLILGYTLIRLNAQAAIVSLILNLLLINIFMFVRIDPFCLSMDRVDKVSSALAIAAVAFVLGRGVFGVFAVRPLRREGS